LTLVTPKSGSRWNGRCSPRQEEGGHLKGWEIVIEIKRLLSEGLDVSEVAPRLKVDRKTVRKYRDLDMEGVAIYPSV
jgi:hypothetical protein